MVTQEEIQQVKQQFRAGNRFVLTKTQRRNVLFVGKSRSGKSTTSEVVKDVTYGPPALSLFSDTKMPTFSTFAIENNGQKMVEQYLISLVDTPGLFERREIDDIALARADEAILDTIALCVNNEITAANVVCMFMSLSGGFMQEDFEAINLLIGRFGYSDEKAMDADMDEHDKLLAESEPLEESIKIMETEYELQKAGYLDSAKQLDEARKRLARLIKSKAKPEEREAAQAIRVKLVAEADTAQKKITALALQLRSEKTKLDFLHRQLNAKSKVKLALIVSRADFADQKTESYISQLQSSVLWPKIVMNGMEDNIFFTGAIQPFVENRFASQQHLHEGYEKVAALRERLIKFLIEDCTESVSLAGMSVMKDRVERILDLLLRAKETLSGLAQTRSLDVSSAAFREHSKVLQQIDDNSMFLSLADFVVPYQNLRAAANDVMSTQFDENYSKDLELRKLALGWLVHRVMPNERDQSERRRSEDEAAAARSAEAEAAKAGDPDAFAAFHGSGPDNNDEDEG